MVVGDKSPITLIDLALKSATRAILAASASPKAMDKRTLDHFGRALRAQRDELQARLNRAKQGNSGVDLKDEGDRATASIASEMTAAQQSQTQSLIRALNAAIDRLDGGHFGDCLNCGQEIELKRLQALPWARYCVVCQGLIEQ